MSLRLVDSIVVLSGIAVGATLTPGTISGEAGRVLAIFLGLVSASLLPTITLLIGSMTANGRSVQAIQRLEDELKAAMDALFLLFGCVVIAVGALISLSIQPASFFTEIPYLTSQVLPRIGQSIVLGATTFVIWRSGQIPAILRRVLEIRREIATDEAKRKVFENAPGVESLRQIFPTQDGFGKVVSLQDLQPRDRQ